MTRNPNWTRDELILALDLYFRVNPVHTSKDNLDIVELSKILNQLPIHAKEDSDEKFRNPNGVYMKLCNFLRFDPEYSGEGLKAGSKLEEEIWNEYADKRKQLAIVAQAIRENAKSLSPPRTESQLSEIVDDDEEFKEGRILTRVHRLRERNPALVKKKKSTVLKATGNLACEVCSFDFYESYGAIGQGFAECHHNKPLSTIKPTQKTKISDLSIVCSNCHRMLHRSDPWLSISQLKETIRTL